MSHRRRTLVPLVALLAAAAPAALLALAACSSSSKPAAVASGPDATADADAGITPVEAAADDATDELTVSTVCGAGPHVDLGIVVVGLSLDNPSGDPLPGAQFTSPLCPTVVQYSDDGGNIRGQVTADVAFYGRLQAPNYMPELTPEEIFDAGSSGNTIQMLPRILQAILLPEFDASSQTAVVIAAEATVADAGACSGLDGISFAVPGHPEAQTTYFSSDTVPAPLPDAGATSTRGLAAITGLAADQFVQLAATKPGCTVAFQYKTVTGRTALETGFVSLTPAYLSP